VLLSLSFSPCPFPFLPLLALVLNDGAAFPSS
jgi:hypothetical protein